MLGDIFPPRFTHGPVTVGRPDIGNRLPDKDFGLRYWSESSTTYYRYDLLRFLPLALPKSLSETLKMDTEKMAFDLIDYRGDC